MYGMRAYFSYHKNQPTVGKYTIYMDGMMQNIQPWPFGGAKDRSTPFESLQVDTPDILANSVALVETL